MLFFNLNRNINIYFKEYYEIYWEINCRSLGVDYWKYYREEERENDKVELIYKIEILWNIW